MRISLFSIVGILILIAVYWAGSRNALAGVISAVRGAVGA